MIILSAQGVAKAFGTNEVLKDVTFALQQGQRLGLVGVNGCGKSTLMKILAGLDTADAGQLNMNKGLRIGYLAQQGMTTHGNTVYQELYQVYAPVMAMEKRLRQIEMEMSENHTDEVLVDRLGREYAHLTEEFEEAGGYSYQSSIYGVLSGLGFSKEQYDQMADSLSGGERTRLCLGRLLLQKPDLLLLDEPTNHLDLAAISWLENYLTEYKGTVLVISHDRYFLDHICTNMMELLMGTVECYDGNYSVYMTKRTQRFEARMKAFELQQKTIAREKVIIERYRSFNREKSIRAAESREKRLEKMELVDKPDEENAIHFSFTARRRTGEDVLMADNLSKSFGERKLFENINLHLRAGDRVALIGANGVGKSTLFKLIMHQTQPDTGEVRYGSNVDIGYYDQHQSGLHDDKTVLDEVWDDFRLMNQSEIRGALGMFLFSGDDVFMPISTLSGGEKGRVALTKLMLRKDNFLLLDEPTNHLDMDSREVLEDALADYQGTILAISHDRYFINRFANKVLVMESGGVREYLGNYDDYIEKINRQQMPDNELFGKTKTEMDKEKKKNRAAKEQVKAARARLTQIESDIAKTEDAISALEEKMALPETYQNPQLSANTAKEYQAAQDRLEKLYEDWETAEQTVKDMTEEA